MRRSSRVRRLGGASRLVLDQPEVHILVFAFLLNFPWELGQVPFFAGMAGATHWAATKVCAMAAVGDAAVTLTAYWAVAAGARSRQWVRTPTFHQLLVLVIAGLLITSVVEHLATRYWTWWSYSAAMPVFPGLEIGLLPLLQWLILPPIVVWFVRRQLN